VECLKGLSYFQFYTTNVRVFPKHSISVRLHDIGMMKKLPFRQMKTHFLVFTKPYLEYKDRML